MFEFAGINSHASVAAIRRWAILFFSACMLIKHYVGAWLCVQYHMVSGARAIEGAEISMHQDSSVLAVDLLVFGGRARGCRKNTLLVSHLSLFYA